ncbi:hypothetical protein [Trueperella pyogenes]|uniref:hypothetical protein n=1 Tax=Trueperella pyogenes TaxID=1661 RepID=UPI003DA9AEBF
MPRAATPVYPKDAGQIIQQGDVFPGARVFEAGVGSGGLSLSLLAAVGPGGHLTSCERRPEFAEIAQANVESWYGAEVPPWDLMVGDAADALYEMEAESLDHVVLDMLAPWEIIASAAHALRSGGVVICYVTTTTQLSRFVEKLRDSECFTEPEALKRCSAPGISMASQCGRTTRWSDIPASSLSLAALRGVLLRSYRSAVRLQQHALTFPNGKTGIWPTFPSAKSLPRSFARCVEMWRIARMWSCRDLCSRETIASGSAVG